MLPRVQPASAAGSPGKKGVVTALIVVGAVCLYVLVLLLMWSLLRAAGRGDDHE